MFLNLFIIFFPRAIYSDTLFQNTYVMDALANLPIISLLQKPR